MIQFYGTYLTYLVKELFLKEDAPLSTEEVAKKIHQYDQPRLQYNLERRVRRVLGFLEEEGFVERKIQRGKGNTVIYLYQISINDDRKEQAECH